MEPPIGSGLESMGQVVLASKGKSFTCGKQYEITTKYNLGEDITMGRKSVGRWESRTIELRAFAIICDETAESAYGWRIRKGKITRTPLLI